MKKLVLVLALVVFACCANGAYLWDQWGTYLNGFASQDFESSYDCYDVYAADDFEVTGPGWLVKDIHWDAYFRNTNVVVNSVEFIIMKPRTDGWGDLNNVVWSEIGLYNKALSTGEIAYDVVNQPTLGPGVYFLCVQPDLTFGTYSQHFSGGHASGVYGKEFRMINPNGCFGSGTDWFVPTGYNGMGMNFRISGDIVPEPGVISLAGLLLGAGALWLRRK